MKKGKYVRGSLLADSPTLNDFGAVENNDTKWYQNIIPIVFIVLLTAFVYSFSLDNNATNWDDDKYTDKNPLLKTLDSETISRMFTSDKSEELYFMGNYHPLTMLSLNLTYHFSDLMPNGKVYPTRFIVVNVLFHLLSCVLVYFVFSLLFKNRIYPIVIALLFGIHTLHVESVTWISERKDVLYVMLYFMSLMFYILYRRKNNVIFYILSLIVFIFSALSKGQAVSLAVTLFLVDYLILEDYLNWKKHLNKIPFFVIALIFGIISIKAQAQSTALAETDQYEIYQRIAFGSNGFLQYILRFILPVKLANLYPYPDIINRTVPVSYWLTVPLFVIALLSGLFLYKRNKTLTFGIMFFIVNIALLLQFIPVGSAMYADRYAYIPSVGLSVLLAYLIEKLIEKYEKYRVLFYIIFSIYTLLICYLTINREKVWHDSGSLWSDCVSKYPEAVIGWNNLGSYHNMVADSFYKKIDDNKFIELKKIAIDCFSNGIKYKPDYVNSYFNRGMSAREIYEITNDTSYLNKALSDYNSAILYNLNFAPAFQNRAIIYDEIAEGFADENNMDSSNFYVNLAISDYNRALDLDPNLIDIYINRGTTYGKSGNYAKSIEDFNTYLKINSNNATLYSNRGLAYNGIKQYDLALEDFSKSIQLDSTFESAYFNRSITYRLLGDSLSQNKYYNSAADDLSKCISLSPNKGVYYFYRAVCYLAVNDRVGACSDFQEAYNLNYPRADYYIQTYCNTR